MKSRKLSTLITLTLAIGFTLVACNSPSDGGGGGNPNNSGPDSNTGSTGSNNSDSSGTGSNTGGTDGGGANNSSGGNTLSGMYYREFVYENQIQFNNNGTYTWTNILGTETDTYTVSDNKVKIKDFTFSIYDSDTLTVDSIISSGFPITFLKDGSYYPVSGTYSATVGGGRFYRTFDDDGTCALHITPTTNKNNFTYSYSISGRIVSTIHISSNKPSDKFVTINSNTFKDESGYLWRKQ